jgi:hypothetical protein
MIIVDLNQVMLSNLMMQLGNHTNAQLEENMVRHMVINAIRSYKVKFGDEYGEIVIACDNRNYWRKQVFPYYKANRKKNIDNSELNWQSIFDCMSKIRSELKEFFPYKVIDIESAEADDIIATLVENYHRTMESFTDIFGLRNVLILSGDKDFIQLHKYDYVKQYDPVRKKFITSSDPARYLKEHILKGDSGDGVPNILSSDNCFVVGERQKPMTQKKLDAWLDMAPEDFCNESQLRNYYRNKQLIDLTMIPENLKEKIFDEYKNQPEKGKDKLLNYFIANRLKNLTEHITEF